MKITFQILFDNDKDTTYVISVNDQAYATMSFDERANLVITYHERAATHNIATNLKIVSAAWAEFERRESLSDFTFGL